MRGGEFVIVVVVVVVVASVHTFYYAATPLTPNKTNSNNVRPKYCNDEAALYGLRLKARAAGQPEPSELPPSMRSGGAGGGGGGGRVGADMSRGDPNGMER